MPNSSRDLIISLPDGSLPALWTVPEGARGVVVFVHGSGSSRFSPRNQQVARVLQRAGLATLLMDLLDEQEAEDRGLVFDIEMLAGRVIGILDWLKRQAPTRDLPVGLFGASTGAAAALRAAARRPALVKAVVSRGGRPDLAWDDLPGVKAPTLLIVGGNDFEVLHLNRSAAQRLKAAHELHIITGATHLFEEQGTLQNVAIRARSWFMKHLVRSDASPAFPRGGFRNRAEAARELAARLKNRALTDPLVLAIPRGGVVLGAILANELHADLDVILSRKLCMPGNPEFAVGAVCETGEVYYNAATAGMSPAVLSYLDRECRRQMEEIARRRALFGQGRPAAPVAGRSVLVTDDGIATGSTMIAALRTLRAQAPLETIVAVPVASPDRLRAVTKECDETVCLIEAPDLQAVGQYYQDFTQVEDEEVVALLQEHSHV